MIKINKIRFEVLSSDLVHKNLRNSILVQFSDEASSQLIQILNHSIDASFRKVFKRLEETIIIIIIIIIKSRC